MDLNLLPDGTGRKAKEVFDGQAQLYRQMYFWLSSACLKCAMDLEIPDIIHKHGRPIPLSQLVLSLNVPPSKATFIRGLMRLLAHNGLFSTITSNSEEGEVSYDLTPASQLLVHDTDYCLSPSVQWAMEPARVDMYQHHLGKWVRGKETTLMETAFGVGFWDFLNQNPAHLARFHEAVDSNSRLMKVAVRDLGSVFGGLSSIVDVGGGTGTTSKIICEAFPKLKCTVLELPEVVADLTGNSNLSFVSGDMFESIPQADAVLLKCILHGWGDDDCIKILVNAKKAISSTNGKGGKVIIIDMVLNEKHEEHELTETKLLFDIILMAEGNGKERSEEEWKQLFLKAGFSDFQIFPILGCRSLIVVYP